MAAALSSPEETDWLSGYLAKHKLSHRAPASAESKAPRSKPAALRAQSAKRRSCSSAREDKGRAAVHPTSWMAPGEVGTEETQKQRQVEVIREPSMTAPTARVAPAAGGRRTSTSNQRRQSMDIGGLQAVRERVTSATSLWALNDDEDEEEEETAAAAAAKAKAALLIPSPSGCSPTKTSQQNQPKMRMSLMSRLRKALS